MYVTLDIGMDIYNISLDTCMHLIKWSHWSVIRKHLIFKDIQFYIMDFIHHKRSLPRMRFFLEERRKCWSVCCVWSVKNTEFEAIKKNLNFANNDYLNLNNKFSQIFDKSLQALWYDEQKSSIIWLFTHTLLGRWADSAIYWAKTVANK